MQSWFKINQLRPLVCNIWQCSHAGKATTRQVCMKAGGGVEHGIKNPFSSGANGFINLGNFEGLRRTQCFHMIYDMITVKGHAGCMMCCVAKKTSLIFILPYHKCTFSPAAYLFISLNQQECLSLSSCRGDNVTRSSAPVKFLALHLSGDRSSSCLKKASRLVVLIRCPRSCLYVSV